MSKFAHIVDLKETTDMFPGMMRRRSGLVVFGILIMALWTSPAQGQQGAQRDLTLPDELQAPAGTVLTIQIDDHLSSDKNASGDTFVGSLEQPLVIDGWVVARRGQTVFGQVVSANSAGRVRGTSDLALVLTELVLVDGQQLPIRTQLVVNHGRQSREEDAATIAGATGIGAIIGAAIGRGKGALIGAGVGAAGATAGVLSTRGKAVEVYSESRLTFRLEDPLIVSTVRSSQAFQAVLPNDYDRERDFKDERRARSARTSYPPEYRDYPRFPHYPGPRLGVIVVPGPIVIDHRDHRRRY